ncbi:hypothetical protein [Bythopirellula polymerisocia]|uniref:Amino acid kinase family protein n=1 Tax=Bythopirellula polymerisocia TaxID=2528003 RepID=A0A5C6C7R3_9BACT|nr:hypothetical protein [Bythopirellula polymerisocia]TWU20057.1 hypothetical protein Pla144_50100 [Bythopirellula polymerisocia]
MPIRVIKVGGSLFDLPDLGNRIRDWIDRQPTAYNLLVAGGGKLVEEVRAQHIQEPIDELTAHWRCIDLMTETARMLANVLPGIEILDSLPETELTTRQCTAIFTPARWLRETEPQLPGTHLCASWDVTSDSLSARLAITCDADELVLLKSATPPSNDLQQLADAGYVDRFLAMLENELPLMRFINLKRTSLDQSRL